MILVTATSLCLVSFIGARSKADVEYETIESGIYVYFRVREPEMRFFQDQQSFESFYTSLHRSRVPAPEAPSVDFTQSIVIFVSAGEKPTAGFSVELVGVRRIKDTLEVEVLLLEPAEGSFQAQVITHPYLIVTTPRADYERIELVNDRGELLDRVLTPEL
jgi:hypothetical protein